MLFRCLGAGRCPGGRPGSCAGGLQYRACTECPLASLLSDLSMCISIYPAYWLCPSCESLNPKTPLTPPYPHLGAQSGGPEGQIFSTGSCQNCTVWQQAGWVLCLLLCPGPNQEVVQLRVQSSSSVAAWCKRACSIFPAARHLHKPTSAYVLSPWSESALDLSLKASAEGAS